MIANKMSWDVQDHDHVKFMSIFTSSKPQVLKNECSQRWVTAEGQKVKIDPQQHLPSREVRTI